MDKNAWTTTSREKKYDFSSTQFDADPKTAENLLAVAAAIPDEDLYTSDGPRSFGREDHPHVTLKFGLHTSDPEEVAAVVSGYGQISMRVGGISLFEEADNDYDVVKFDIESEQLHALNELVSDKLENTDTFPEYKPHMTVAYVNKGKGKDYSGDSPWAKEQMERLSGVEMFFNEVKFSNQYGDKTPISIDSDKTEASLWHSNEKKAEWTRDASIEGISIGTSGFSYNHWSGEFYPEDLSRRNRLSFYAGKFSTVEISSTFHSLPDPKVLAKWYSRTPDGFTFALRGPREVTHERNLIGCEKIMGTFMRRCENLKEKLALVTFQMPESVPFDAAALRHFAANLPSGYRYSMEFRSEPWYNDKTYEILAKYDIALVTVGHSNMGIHPGNPATWSHLRLSGNKPDWRTNSYTTEELRNWSGIVKDATRPTFVHFNNEYKAFAANNAIEMMSLIGSVWEPRTGSWDVAPRNTGPHEGDTGTQNTPINPDQRSVGPENQVEDNRRRHKKKNPKLEPENRVDEMDINYPGTTADPP